MELPATSPSLFFSLTSHFILLLTINSSVSAAKLGNETDKISLLEFKSQIADYSLGALSSWNYSFPFCQWFGVTCSLTHHQRVVSLDLKDQWLNGIVSPHIGNLSFLQSLNLANNSFHGEIPPEVGHLFRLRNLNLSYNYLGGKIPVNLSKCSDLSSLDLGHNSLVHQIPSELGSLLKLVTLFLNENNLTGRFPVSLGNLSSLQKLLLTDNHLEGEIPDSIAQMTTLQVFRVGVNNLSGVFPSWLYNLSSLETLSLSTNKFYGNLRPNIGLAFPNLQFLILAANQFTGTIPASLSNGSNLVLLDISSNNFTRNVPLNFGDLQNLQWLQVSYNHLGNYVADDLSFLTSLTNCSQLWWLDFGYNRFGGELPASVNNLSTKMTWLTLGGNKIGGIIPSGIANLVSLINLCMQGNLFTGSVPASLGTLAKLSGLSLNQNLLTGQIPSSLGNLSQLSELSISNNSLEGTIPLSLANCQHLRYVDLSHNKLNGTIPIQFISISSLSVALNLSDNSFIGSLPPEVGNLKNLVVLDVSNNKLSGVIPSTLGSCMALDELYLQGNFFQGTIPDLSELKGIKFLDLSRNNLSGQIPEYLANLYALQNLNLSFNNLEGTVPVQGAFEHASAVEVYGNNKLCGGIQELRLHACHVLSEKHRKHYSWKLILVIIVSVVMFLALMVASISLCWMRKLKKPLSTPSFGPLYPKVSYEELLKATGGFSLDNLIGKGTFGTVFKGNLSPNETTVAVKVINLQKRGASKSFMAECEALRNIRHRNLVKVLTACSSADFKLNDFKALVYEFMPNGSLETWLHPEHEWQQLRKLSLLQRINIVIDVASALHYLHHQCQTPIVHCDLKPSNVLLDNELTARVSDFGLAKLLTVSCNGDVSSQFSSLGIKGTVGYAAPEYGMGGRVSTQGDVYSYGILLLEVFTGKRPTDEHFKDDLNLHKFVAMAFPRRMIEIADQSVLYGTIGPAEDGDRCLSSCTSEQTECLISVFQVGVKCSAESPRDRMDMKEVVTELLSIREKFLGAGMHEEALHSSVNRNARFLEAI